jgi:hypothetical protein
MPARPPDVRVFVFLLVWGAGFALAGRVLAAGGNAWGGTIFAGGAALELAAVWCLFYSLSPGLMRLLTTSALCGLVVFSLLSCSIHQAREEARRQACLNNLRRVGMAAHEQNGLHYETGGSSSQFYRPAGFAAGQTPD